MPERSGRGLGGAANREHRFDGESVRQILQRAAEEQQRRDSELADSYSREELEEMAVEGGISPEAVRAAIKAHRRATAARTANPPEERPRGWVAALESRMPKSWHPAVKRLVLTSTGVVALIGLLLLLPVIGPVVLWAGLVFLIVLSVLLVLGVSPF